MDVLALESPPAEVAAFRDLHCAGPGCGRRLLAYTPVDVGPRAVIRVRCRDCKTWNELRGADVARLLHALSHQGRDR